MFVAFLGGCGLGPLEAKLPVDADAEAVVLVVEKTVEGGPAVIERVAASNVAWSASGAWELDPGLVPDPFELGPKDRVRLGLLAYDVTLEELGLPAGVLPLAHASNGALLPRGDRGMVFDALGDSDEVVWVPISTAEDWLTQIRLPFEIDPCARLIPDWIELATNTPVSFIEPTVNVAVAGVEDGALFILDPGSVIRANANSPDNALLAVRRADDQAYWFGDRRGRIFRGNLGLLGVAQMQQITATPSGQAIVALDGAFSSTIAVELFTVSRAGTLERYRQGRWQELRQLGAGVTHLLRVGPGEALLVQGKRSILHVREDAFTEDLVAPEEDTVSALAFLPEIGLVAGTQKGRVYAFEGSWTLLGQVQPEMRIRTIIPFRKGFMVAGGLGQAVEFVRGRGFCVPVGRGEAMLTTGASVRNEVFFGGSTEQPWTRVLHLDVH